MKKYNFEAIDGTFEVLRRALKRLDPHTAQAKFLAEHVNHVLLLQNDLVFVKEGIIPEITPDMNFYLKFHISDVFCNSGYFTQDTKELNYPSLLAIHRLLRDLEKLYKGVEV